MPKKSLGQHFLKNKSAIQKIIAALELKKDETIIEIGPGEGALTIPLIEECRKAGCNFSAIEKDVMLADQLRHKGILEVTAGDALKELPKIVENLKNFKIVGNIPYYITGKLLKILSELENKPSLTVLTIQKEVAKRISATPPRMNLLSAATQFWSEPKILMNLKSTDFDPAPEVDSAIIILKTKKTDFDSGKYYRFIKAAFKQPRKTLINNLENELKIPKSEILTSFPNKITDKTRAQELDLALIFELVNKFL